MTDASNCPFCSIAPPYLLYKYAEDTDPDIANSALATLRRLGQSYAARSAMLSTLNVGPRQVLQTRLRRRIFDCENSTDLSANLVLQEGGSIPDDPAVREAYEYSGATWKFFKDQLGRNSIDDHGMTLVSSVHYSINGHGYDNAEWNGSQMIYGDGDVLFNRMTSCIDVVAHELTHGVTQESAALPYANQSGALNEHFSDVFGVVVKHWHGKQSDPLSADWLVGAGLLKTGGALRSLKEPGTANPDDPQPAHMKDYQELPNTPRGDHGGVHINSGIPNRAFYLAATAIGGPSWEIPAKIWYTTLTQRLKGETTFEKCAYETISVARDFVGNDAAVKVAKAWIDVGVLKKKGVGPLASLSF